MRREDLGRLGTGAALLASLAGCGGALPPPTQSQTQPQAYLPNIGQIQTAIAQSVLAHDRLKVRVVCPSVVPEIPGKTFTCVAIPLHRDRQVMTFTVTEGPGTYVTYRQTS